MKTLLLSFLFATGSYLAISQKSFTMESIVFNYDPNGSKAEIGTFQFIVTNNKFEQAFTTDVLFYIEQNRKKDSDVYVKISDFVDLYIPSQKKISSADFVALEPVSK